MQTVPRQSDTITDHANQPSSLNVVDCNRGTVTPEGKSVTVGQSGENRHEQSVDIKEKTVDKQENNEPSNKAVYSWKNVDSERVGQKADGEKSADSRESNQKTDVSVDSAYQTVEDSQVSEGACHDGKGGEERGGVAGQSQGGEKLINVKRKEGNTPSVGERERTSASVDTVKKGSAERSSRAASTSSEDIRQKSPESCVKEGVIKSAELRDQSSRVTSPNIVCDGQGQDSSVQGNVKEGGVSEVKEPHGAPSDSSGTNKSEAKAGYGLGPHLRHATLSPRKIITALVSEVRSPWLFYVQECSNDLVRMMAELR